MKLEPIHYAILAGIAKHQDGGQYLGSTASLKHYVKELFRDGYLENESSYENTLTEKGMKAYKKVEPYVRECRFYLWDIGDALKSETFSEFVGDNWDETARIDKMEEKWRDMFPVIPAGGSFCIASTCNEAPERGLYKKWMAAQSKEIDEVTVIDIATGEKSEVDDEPAEKDDFNYGDLDGVIARIAAGLKKRSGKTWSVRRGKGTAYSWITITAPPKRQLPNYGGMTKEDQKELGDLLGLEKPVHYQGENIPASNAYRREYVARAEGRTPPVHGTPYWD